MKTLILLFTFMFLFSDVYNTETCGKKYVKNKEICQEMIPPNPDSVCCYFHQTMKMNLGKMEISECIALPKNENTEAYKNNKKDSWNKKFEVTDISIECFN